MALDEGSHGVFISHTHADKAIADAFRDLIAELFAKHWTVSYSTDEEHGPKHGGKWLQWIEQQVRTSDFTLVFLTPSSLQKPWILWEAGAVAGTAVVAGGEETRKMRPLLFRIAPEQVPDPFRDIQVARGDSYEDLEKMLFEWMEQLPPAMGARAGAKLAQAI